MAVVLVAVPVALGACQGSTTSTVVPPALATSTVDSPASTTTAQEAVAADSPSQSEADAIRDGVIPDVATLPPQLRINPLVRVDVEEGIWLLSRLDDRVIDDSMKDGCGLGNLDGIYGTDVICTVEYGEILLLDARGEISKAYPMPGAVPSWIYAAPDAIYAGTIGDGALPDATVVRIDRATLQPLIVLMPAPVEGGQNWPSTWHIAAAEHMGPQLVGFAPDMSGTLVDSWVGNVVVDLDAIDVFLSQFAG